MTENGFPTVSMGQEYTDKSVASLTIGQAGGAEPVLLGNPFRTSLKITPSADCVITIGADLATGFIAYGGVPNSYVGVECPTNTLFVRGLPVGASIDFLEA